MSKKVWDTELCADGTSSNAEMVKLIKQEWINNNMKNKEGEYTETKSCTIFCGTWNVNAKTLKVKGKDKVKTDIEEKLDNWFFQHGKPADIYAVGFQEIVDLNVVNVGLDGSKSTERAEIWKKCIEETLNSYQSDTTYKLVMEKHLVGVLLCVFIKQALFSRVLDVRGIDVAVGFGGIMGNKGGVSIRMNLYDTSICFVCSHLSAHQDKVDSRNKDFKNIMEQTIFKSESQRVVEQHRMDSIMQPKHGADKSIGINLKILDHDIIFWLGDLNYRIDIDNVDEVFQLVGGNELDYLRKKDQLNMERSKKNVFQDFDEGLLTFPPTYKFQPGTDLYEQRPEKKRRSPAWCDRILWNSVKTNAVTKQCFYTSYPNYLISDHKPVGSLFECNLQSLVKNKENELFLKLVNELDKWRDIEPAPIVEIRGESNLTDNRINIDKIDVRFNIPTTLSIPIKACNGGGVLYWYFDQNITQKKSWISFNAIRGMLLPTDPAFELIVTVNVDTKTAQQLNQGKESLEDTLVLTIDKSHNIHIMISANYLRSCYGVSFEELVITHGPIRATTIPTQQKLLGTLSSGSSTSPPLQIPKELWRLVDALWTGGAIREKDLFATPGKSDEIISIRESLDCGENFNKSFSPHSIVEALITLVESFPSPIISNDVCPMAEVNEQTLRAYCREILDKSSPLNFNLFVYIISFMREVYSQRDYNRTTIDLLTNVCITMLLPLQEVEEFNKQMRLEKVSKLQPIIKYFITGSSL